MMGAFDWAAQADRRNLENQAQRRFHHPPGGTRHTLWPQARRGRQAGVLVLDNGPIHTSKASRAALEARSHWLTVEWLPNYAPKLNDFEIVWRNLKAHHLAHQTFATEHALEQAIIRAVTTMNQQARFHPLAIQKISAEVPMTALVIILEITGDHQAVMPIMTVSMIGYVKSRILSREPLYHDLSRMFIAAAIRARRARERLWKRRVQIQSDKVLCSMSPTYPATIPSTKSANAQILALASLLVENTAPRSNGGSSQSSRRRTAAAVLF